MFEVAIIGAGELGGALASMLAERDVVRSVHLIDAAGAVAAGKALDIAQSAAVRGFSTSVTGSPDVTATAGAHVVVLADDGATGEWSVERGTHLLKRIAFGTAESILICAGATQRALIEHGIRSLQLPRKRLFGTAPEAFAGALRAMVALETNGSPRDVALTVLGVPPDQTVVPWQEATIGGIAATRVLDEPARRRLISRMARLWPPGPTALAAAAVSAVEAVVGVSKQQMSAFVGPDDSQGRRTRTAALPVRLNDGGIEKIELQGLSVRNQLELDNAMLL
jgi:malate dehydrogenase